jgi:hypothetical protein
MMAGFWGGNQKIIHDICILGEKMYMEDYIAKEQIDNEQVIFGFILKKYKDKLLKVLPTNIECVNYYLFCNKIT